MIGRRGVENCNICTKTRRRRFLSPKIEVAYFSRLYSPPKKYEDEFLVLDR